MLMLIWILIKSGYFIVPSPSTLLLDTLDLLKDLFFPPAALANEDIKEEEKSFKGQHEGPFINPELSPNVTGVLGKEVRLACHVEHLANKTVSRSFYEIKPSLPPTQKIC